MSHLRPFYGDRMGSMPDGSMSWSWRRAPLAGHTCSTIVLHFNFQSGSSNGQVYDGRSQHAYLPNNEEGRKLLAMFQLAFRRRVLFSLTESLTTRRWQPTFAIHLKTSMTGGPAMHGYPDSQYFESATEELRLAGIDLDAALPVAICLHRGSSQMLKLPLRCLHHCFLHEPGATHLAFCQPLGSDHVNRWQNDPVCDHECGPGHYASTKAANLNSTVLVFLTALTSAPLNPTPWISILTMTVMILAMIFAVGHLVARTQPCFGRIRLGFVRTFQTSEARLTTMILLLLVSRNWTINSYGLVVFVVDCAALALLLACKGYLMCRRRSNRSRLPLGSFGTEPLLSDMQQALQGPMGDGHNHGQGSQGSQGSHVHPLGAIQEEDWASYASTPSLQGRTDMKTIHGRFLQSLEASARAESK